MRAGRLTERSLKVTNMEAGAEAGSDACSQAPSLHTVFSRPWARRSQALR